MKKLFKPLAIILTFLFIVFLSYQLKSVPTAKACATSCSLPAEINKTTITPNSSAEPNGRDCPAPNPMPTQVQWAAASGATKYAIRIHDNSVSWGSNTTCDTTDSTYPNACSDNVSGTSFPFAFQAGHAYSIWMYSINSCGWTDTNPITNPDPITAWYSTICPPATPTIGTPTCTTTSTGTTAKITFTTGVNTAKTSVYYCNQTVAGSGSSGCGQWLTQPNGYGTANESPASPNATSPTTISGLVAGDTYNVFVRACDSSNTSCVDSSTQGNATTFTCPAACKPATCSSTQVCGTISDGCGGTVTCGTCPSGQTCTNNACSCTPTTSCSNTQVCGTISNGCGGTVTCGTCPSGQACTNNTCGCPSGQTAPFNTCANNICTVSNNACGTSSCTTPGANCGSTTLSLTIGLDGIGHTGDRVNQTWQPVAGQSESGSNQNPLHPTRTVAVTLIPAAGGTTLGPFKGSVTYDSATGKFKTTTPITLSQTPNGTYTVKIQVPGYLVRTLATNQNIVAGANNIDASADALSLVAGDINGDNQLDGSDYQILISCNKYSTDSSTCNLSQSYSTISDLDDNGTIDQFDYNLFLREISKVQTGD